MSKYYSKNVIFVNQKKILFVKKTSYKIILLDIGVVLINLSKFKKFSNICFKKLIEYMTGNLSKIAND